MRNFIYFCGVASLLLVGCETFESENCVEKKGVKASLENCIEAGKFDENGSIFHFPAKQITFQPGYHWFGYYDKLQTDPSERYALTMKTSFEGRSPTSDDIIEIGMIDLEDDCKYTKLGTSRSWGWQQGCQLQFMPNSDSEIIWNDKDEGNNENFVTRIFNIKTKKMRTIPFPVYSLSPDGKFAITSDYRRINDTRPGYGYAGIPDPNADIDAPKDSGIWRVNMETGEAVLILSIAEIAKLENPFDPEAESMAKHWFNHLLISPDGERFVFLHRWRHHDKVKNKKLYANVGGFGTRMITANCKDGSDLRIVDPYNYTSHFIWNLDSRGIMAWSRIPEVPRDAFFIFEDKQGGEIREVGEGVMTRNGHNTYLPENPNLVLNDTYPRKRNRLQSIYIYNMQTNKRTPLADLYSPKEYTGEWRCDTHPRASAKGNYILVDSPHKDGRQIYMIDIRGVDF